MTWQIEIRDFHAASVVACINKGRDSFSGTRWGCSPGWASTRRPPLCGYASQWPSMSYRQFRDKTQKGKIQIDSGRVYWSHGNLLHHKLFAGKNNTAQTYEISHNKNQSRSHSKPDIDAKNLANQSWYIERQKKLTPTELQDIQDRARRVNNVYARPYPPQDLEATQLLPVKLGNLTERLKRSGKCGSPTDPEGWENCRSGKHH